MVIDVPERSELPPKVILDCEDSHAWANGCYCIKYPGKIPQDWTKDLQSSPNSKVLGVCLTIPLSSKHISWPPSVLGMQSTADTLAKKPDMRTATQPRERSAVLELSVWGPWAPKRSHECRPWVAVPELSYVEVSQVKSRGDRALQWETRTFRGLGKSVGASG